MSAHNLRVRRLPLIVARVDWRQSRRRQRRCDVRRQEFGQGNAALEKAFKIRIWQLPYLHVQHAQVHGEHELLVVQPPVLVHVGQRPNLAQLISAQVRLAEELLHGRVGAANRALLRRGGEGRLCGQ